MGSEVETNRAWLSGLCNEINRQDRFSLTRNDVHRLREIIEQITALEAVRAAAETQQKRVYISGPITKGNRNHNYFQALEAEAELMRNNFAPLNPMQTMVLPFAWDGEFDHARWLERDFAWIAVCDAVLRIPGESVGAEAEREFAEKCGIPVFCSLKDLMEWRLAREGVKAT